MRIIIFVVYCFAFGAAGTTIEKVEFPENLTVSGSELVLNGVGLRSKRKLGMNFRVYVAGLYLKAQSQDFEKIIRDGDHKVIDMVFLRSVDQKTIQESWGEQIEATCWQKCETVKLRMKPFIENLAAVKDKSKVRLVFDKKGLSVTASEQNEKRIDDPILATDVLAVFIGSKPATEDLKKGLLGL